MKLSKKNGRYLKNAMDLLIATATSGEMDDILDTLNMQRRQVIINIASGVRRSIE